MPAALTEVSFLPFHLRSDRPLRIVENELTAYDLRRMFYGEVSNNRLEILQDMPLQIDEPVEFTKLPLAAQLCAAHSNTYPDVLTDGKACYSNHQYIYLRRKLTALKDHDRRFAEQYTTSVRKLAQEKQQLESNGNQPIVLKRADLQQALKPLAHIIPQRSIRLSLDSSNRPWLSWQFHNIQMRPQHNSYSAINLCAPTTVPLPPFGLTTQLTRNGTTKLKRIRNVTYPTLYTYNSVHPHMMSGMMFCMGDYGGPLEELRLQHDFVSYIMMLKSFCETCNPHDAAGISWRRYYPFLFRDVFQPLTSDVCLEERTQFNSSFTARWVSRELNAWLYADFIMVERDGQRVFTQVSVDINPTTGYDRLTVVPFEKQWRYDRNGTDIPEMHQLLSNHGTVRLATADEIAVIDKRLQALVPGHNPADLDRVMNHPIDWTAASGSPAAIIETPPAPPPERQVRVLGEVQSLEEAYAA